MKASSTTAYVFSGADRSLLRTLDDPNPNADPRLGSQFGTAVAGAGDVDGDSVPDLLVGAPFHDVGSDQWQGQAFVFSGADGSLLHTLNEPVPDGIPSFTALFGSAVAGVGDVNGDGRADLLVGAHQQNAAGNNYQGRADTGGRPVAGCGA